MKLKLNPWQRIMLTLAVGSLRGVNIATIRKGEKALDVLELSPVEEKAIGFVKLDGGFTWDQTKQDLTFDLEIGDKEAAHVVKMAFTQFTGFDMAHKELVKDLERQLGVKEE